MVNSPAMDHRRRRPTIRAWVSEGRFVMTGITRILVPTDFSATSDAALTYAKRLAEQFEASLHLLHAFEDPFIRAAFAAEVYASVPLDVRQQLRCEAEAHLDDRLTADERLRFRATTEIVSGTATKAIVQYAGAVGADLIVMGTHGRGGMAHLLLGSVAERVVRTAPCSVLTLRDAPTRPVRRILVPTDFSATADAALDRAFALASRLGSEVQLLHVLEDPLIAEGLAAEAYIAEAPAMRTSMLREARTRLDHRGVTPEPGVTVHRDVLFGHNARTIAEYAASRDIDLIVMGTHGRTGVAHVLLGSVAERLVRTASCPVLTVRPATVREQPYGELAYAVDQLPA
jgi:nucleotide-binding universal stress UspA family protein